MNEGMTLEECYTQSAATDPIVQIRLAPDGRPLGASAVTRIARPIARVWEVVADVERYAGRVPMISRLRKQGARIEVDLKFKVALFTAGFEFTADVTSEHERWLEIRWVAGEPRGIHLRFELTSIEDGRACLVRGDGSFDAMSLGWLVKYFLKHHPEIQHGIFPGVTLILLDSMRRAAEADA
jgi:ribosome-associated toxin RatA of RatAB toxin-antitoxin module